MDEIVHKVRQKEKEEKMSSVKFVHILKRIESLDRDIAEIQALAADINSDRKYSNPLKISLEQQVNTMLGERVKLMEVRIENPPDYLDPTKSEIDQTKSSKQSGVVSSFAFETLEQLYYEHVREKRSGIIYNLQTPIGGDVVKREHAPAETEKKRTTSLAEKSMTKSDDGIQKESLIKKRADLLKNLPPLEY